MKTLSKDARGLIDGVARYIRSDRRGRDVLPKINALFTKVTNAAQKERSATVASVVQLSAAEKTAVAHVLERLLGHGVICKFVVDEGLLGGLKIQVADWIVDTSLSGQLTGLADTLL